jgi:hypothetical protein
MKFQLFWGEFQKKSPIFYCHTTEKPKHWLELTFLKPKQCNKTFKKVSLDPETPMVKSPIRMKKEPWQYSKLVCSSLEFEAKKYGD